MSRWSKVIKHDTGRMTIEAYDMVDLEAERLAREAAEDVHDCSQLQRESFESGRQRGLQQGREEVQRQADAQVQQALNLVAQLAQIRIDGARQAESDIVDLAMAIAKKIIFHEASIDKNILITQVRQIIGHMEEKGLVRIRLNPDEVEACRMVRATCTGADGKPVRLHIESDPTIQVGGGVVESNQYFIDATVETQLEHVWHELMESYVQSDDPVQDSSHPTCQD